MRPGTRIWQPRGLSDNILFSWIFNSVVADWSKSSRKGPVMKPSKPHSETTLMLKGWGLTTAEFFYRMPDFRHVLNSYVWQDYDLAPDYPTLFKFIEYWQKEIEGPLHSVRFTHRKLIGPGQWRHVVGEYRLN
jgi:uncharacterized protein Usg